MSLRLPATTVSASPMPRRLWPTSDRVRSRHRVDSEGGRVAPVSDRSLAVWIIAAMAVGLVLGRLIPGLDDAVDAVKGLLDDPAGQGIHACGRSRRDRHQSPRAAHRAAPGDRSRQLTSWTRGELHATRPDLAPAPRGGPRSQTTVLVWVVREVPRPDVNGATRAEDRACRYLKAAITFGAVFPAVIDIGDLLKYANGSAVGSLPVAGDLHEVATAVH